MDLLPADEESAGNRSLGKKREHFAVLLQVMALGLERTLRVAQYMPPNFLGCGVLGLPS